MKRLAEHLGNGSHMDRGVNILRSKHSGHFLLNPVGTFRRYGGYVGINPYREVSVAATPEELGRSILDLLELSGPTEIEIADVKQYLRETADEETLRLRDAYGLGSSGMTTSRMAQRFLHAAVEQRHRQKSWVIQVYRYNSQQRAITATEDDLVRVRHVLGPSGLGLAVQRGLEIGNLG